MDDSVDWNMLEPWITPLAIAGGCVATLLYYRKREKDKRRRKDKESQAKGRIGNHRFQCKSCDKYFTDNLGFEGRRSAQSTLQSL